MVNKGKFLIILPVIILIYSGCTSSFSRIVLNQETKLIVDGRIKLKELEVYYNNKNVESISSSKDNYRIVFSSIFSWPNLKEIQINNVPNDICSYIKPYLSKIKTLHLSTSESEALPFCLIEMFNLEKLNINLMPHLDWGSAFLQLSRLNNLSHLDISSNNIIELHPNISLLKRINELSMDYNKLQYIPESIFSLDSLQILSIRLNKIKDVNNLMNSDLSSKLIKISLSRNEINQFKINDNKEYILEEISLDNNQIKILNFSSFNRMPNLKSILFSDNPITLIELEGVVNNRIEWVGIPCHLNRLQFEEVKKIYTKSIVYCSMSYF